MRLTLACLVSAACAEIDFNGDSGTGASSHGGMPGTGGAPLAGASAEGGRAQGGAPLGGGGAAPQGGDAQGGSAAQGGSGPTCPGDDAPACGSSETFALVLPFGWVPGGATPSIDNGELLLSVTSPANSYSRLDSTSFPFVSCAVWFELVEAETMSGWETRAFLLGGPGAGFGFYVHDGLVELVGAGATIGYDPVAMRYLRLREAEGTTYYETSPDGDCWQARGNTASNPVSAQSLRLSLFNETSVMFPAESRFDNFCVP